MEDSTRSWNVEPFVAVRDEEVCVKLTQVERQVTDSMGAIDEAHYASFPTFSCQTLKRKPDSWKRGNCVEDRYLRFQTFALSLLDHIKEVADDFIEATGHLIVDFADNQSWYSLHQTRHDLLTGAVDSVEVDEGISLFIDQVAEDEVDG